MGPGLFMGFARGGNTATLIQHAGDVKEYDRESARFGALEMPTEMRPQEAPLAGNCGFRHLYISTYLNNLGDSGIDRIVSFFGLLRDHQLWGLSFPHRICQWIPRLQYI